MDGYIGVGHRELREATAMGRCIVFFWLTSLRLGSLVLCRSGLKAQPSRALSRTKSLTELNSASRSYKGALAAVCPRHLRFRPSAPAHRAAPAHRTPAPPKRIVADKVKII